jgi:hypothetical protein
MDRWGMARDLKYTRLITGGLNVTNNLRRAVGSCQVESVRRTARPFLSNLDRVSDLAVLPREIAYQVRRDEILIAIAVYKATGKVGLTMDEVLSRALTPEVGRMWSQEIKKHESISHAKAEQFRTDIGTKYIEGMIQVNLNMRRSVDSILRLTIINTWSYFECLAEDLVLSSVKKHATRFSHVASDKSWRFRSRDQIRKSYKQAFKPEDPDILTAVYSDGIEALALLRNVLVHKAGIADNDFRTGAAASPLLTPFRPLNDGDEIELDGEVVRSPFLIQS